MLVVTRINRIDRSKEKKLPLAMPLLNWACSKVKYSVSLNNKRLGNMI